MTSCSKNEFERMSDSLRVTVSKAARMSEQKKMKRLLRVTNKGGRGMEKAEGRKWK